MLSAAEQRKLRERAYVPEHLVGLMSSVSGGEPFLIDEYFCCVNAKWVIVVGYPLGDDFQPRAFEMVLDRVLRRFRPHQISFIAPQLPFAWISVCQEREADWYYILPLERLQIRSGVKRLAEKAARKLTLETSTRMQAAHTELIDEFLQRVRPPPRIEALYRKMPNYVGSCPDARVLNAWDKYAKLAGFYVVDLAAVDFAAYVIGCHSKRNYAAGASDLLFHDMVRIGREHGKHYVHLGLGVNEGIRRFKEKWGGQPSRPYQMCEASLEEPPWLEFVRALGRFGSTD